MTNEAQSFLPSAGLFLTPQGEKQVIEEQHYPPQVRLLKRFDNVDLIEVKIADMRGGFRTKGTLGRGPVSFHSSTLDTRSPGLMNLMALVTQDNPTSSTTIAGGDVRLCSCNIFGVLALGVGATNNAALFGETSATDPTVVAKTYTATTSITDLRGIIAGGLTTAERLFICRADNQIQIASDLGSTPTIDATMHTDTDKSWGVLQSPIDGLIGIYSNGALRTLARTATVTDQPAATGVTVPNGGWPIEILRLADIGYIRAFWVIPKANRTSQARSGNQIVHTLLDFTDPVPFPLPDLKDVAWAIPWGNEAMGVSDGKTIIKTYGRRVKNLRWRLDAGGPLLGGEKGGVGTVNAYAAVARGDDLYVAWRMTVSGISVDTGGIDYYNAGLDAWFPVATGLTNTAGLAHGEIALSKTTDNLHVFLGTQTSSSQWPRVFAPAPSAPLYTYRGSATYTGQSFQSAGTVRTADYHIDGYEGMPKVVAEIECFGDAAEGGTDATIEIEVADQLTSSLSYSNNISHVVRAADRWDKYRRKFPSNTSAFDRLGVQWTLTRGSTADRTPQGLPTVVRLLVFRDGKVKTPASVLSGKWGDW